jgi:DNA (cytosine-5)-methyltransferase 1
MKRLIKAVDLFCGGGGSSSGLRRFCRAHGYKLQLTAVNHWDIAIATHSANHPDADHMCASVDAVDPRQSVPGGYLDILVASPECTDHSNAKGGRPVSDQRRASAWLVLRWLELLYVKTVVIENVKEFQQWGPVGANGRPLASKRGETFRAFVAALKSLGYRVEWRVLNAADYGDATTRERLFLIARRGNRKISWPEPTHTESSNGRLFGDRAKWRGAREIIDWTIPGKSIFNRKRPLSPLILRQIVSGMEEFGGEELRPFLVILRNHGKARSVDSPVPTLTAGGGHIGLARPFVLQLTHGGRTRSVDKPLPTITCAHRGEMGIISPMITKYYGTGRSHPVSDPLPTVTTKDRFGLVMPIVGDRGLDIHFRMFQPSELAGAMGFDPDYQFQGTRGDIVKQIGNAVPVNTAQALCEAVLA